MDDALLDAILERLDAASLDEQVEDLLLAACQGDESLDAALGGHAPPRPERKPTEQQGAELAEPVGAYLRSITVEGFRGVGPEATLQLQPGPGLTVVVGRNGSGKSTFAEGLEVLLTGTSDRFRRQTVFRDGWRNLHASGRRRVAATLHVAGAAGTTTVERVWPEGDADLGDGEATVQLPGEQKAPIEVLGWQDHLDLHRPFLAHSELQATFAGQPSDLYDRLSQALGLEALTGTQKRLADRRLALERATKEVEKQRTSLLPSLTELAGDERAREVHRLLSAKTPDLDAIEALVTGAAAPEGGGRLARLRALAHLAGPDLEVTAEVAQELRAAADALDAVAATDAARCARLADLLDAALDHHAAHGAVTVDCPVCGRSGALDDRWRAETEAEVADLRARAEAATNARRRADAALSRARSLLSPPPEAVAADVPADLGVDLAALVAAWGAWADAPGTDDCRALADHLDRRGPQLADAVRDAASAAHAELARRQDLWSPVARQLAAWVEQARRAAAAAPSVKALRKAEQWLKGAHDELRNERFRPIAEQAQAIWQELRHESNVDLDDIRLAGSSNKRRVEFAVDVDGADGSALGVTALGVMSQGEVNALALSVFLPRATLPESPFRFVVIDDPVQAMDPAKVDGLARVLDRYAQDRQVIVFTHDDRLPAAIRHLGIDARILQVHRRPGSIVEITSAKDPARRALEDARAVARDENAPPEVVARVVPGQCRLAVEAACVDAARRRLLAGGLAHADVEARLTAARTLTQKAALALFGDLDRGSEVLGRLDRIHRSHADTFRLLNKGAHGPVPVPPLDVVRDAERLVEAIAGACP